MILKHLNAIILSIALLVIQNTQEASQLLLQVQQEAPAQLASLTENILKKLQEQQTPATTTSNSSYDTSTYNLNQADDNGIYLVGLFDLHLSNPKAPFRCGPMELDAGELHSRRPMQNMEAFLWAIEQVNADKSLLPGVKLGSLVMDTCSSFLRTNQQLANLLHQPSQVQPGAQRQPVGVRQIAAIVADNADWQSVEAVASMASAQGLTTFVTQARSSRLSEFARRYKPSNLANLEAQQQLAALKSADQQYLSELLGIGKLTTTASSPALSLDQLVEAAMATTTTPPPEAEDSQQQQHQRLLMVRMLLGNEMLSDAIGSLCDQMGWSLVSVVYDDEPEMVDLHDELARQLFGSRNVQLALDEQVVAPVASSGPSASSVQRTGEIYERLLQNLARKAQQMGSRVVITLLGAGSARNLLEALHRLRNNNDSNQLDHINSLLWVTVADREPYYSLATDALGTVSVSSSASLLADFKSYYDQLRVSEGRAHNKWWPDYVKSILVRHSKELELVSSECAKWQEPSSSPLRDKCGSLSLSSLVEINKLKEQLKARDSPRPDVADQQQQQQQRPASNSSSTFNASQSSGKPNNRPSSTPNKAAKLSKYLAGGWDHNGMDVINSVLSVANGLESIRQALCPDTPTGLCDRMRELLSSSQPTNHELSSSSSSSLSAANPADEDPLYLPMLSELIYNELLRSTFQLTDGRMFNLLDEFSGQLEGRLKLYNLRFLRQNSIGFVKFAHFDQQDGLVLNHTKAMHYPSNTFAQQVPIERVKSSCQDERRCLMLGSLLSVEGAGGSTNNASQPGRTNQSPAASISEEELASGVNSLFKLDHPLISSSPASSGQPGLQELDPDIQTLRPQADLMLAGDSKHQQRVDTRRGHVIVLLPVHKYQSSSSLVAPANSTACSSGVVDLHAFQQLVGLAYVQANHQVSASAEPNNMTKTTTTTTMTSAEHYRKKKIELTISVIDYCGQAELAASKLAGKLRELTGTNNDNNRKLSPSAIGGGGGGGGGDNYDDDGTTGSKESAVVVIDFDSKVGRLVDRQLAANTNTDHRHPHLAKPLHLTIAQAKSGDKSFLSSHAKQADESKSSDDDDNNDNHHHGHLRVNLLPSKANEIEGLVRVIKSMATWRLVHLIYADYHHYRDEFVRRANEANICVSKMIWIPGNRDASSGENSDDYLRQLELTRQLFASELYDHSNGATNTNNSIGLNSTRVLVVLASSSDQTNRMILEASSRSMLTDYVWLTTHEWLQSVELPHELALDEQVRTTGDNHIKTLPRYLLSTRLESSPDSRHFRHYFAHLTPALHAPIPTGWFDQFWQQHFRCQLPIGPGVLSATSPGVCPTRQHLEWSQIIEDDRVHYTIRALESVYAALGHLGNETSDDRLHEEFKRHFDGGAKHPLGFNIVHRMLARADLESQTDKRRSNSRNLEGALQLGQLTKVGVWRDNELILLTNRQMRVVNSRLNSSSSTDSNRTEFLGRLLSYVGNDGADEDLATRIGKSLDRLATIRSRCNAEQTCRLCKQQIDQTQALIKQQEALASLGNEPKVITSIVGGLLESLSGGDNKRTKSRLDGPAESSFDDTEDDNGEDNTNKLQQENKTSSVSGSANDDILASASSLFDTKVRSELASETRRSYGHFYSHHHHLHQSRGLGPATGGLRHFSGIMMSILSLVGIGFMVASMTYYYPNMLDNKLSSETSYAHGDDDDQHHLQGASFSSSVLANINDYFMLTGLLMLYSINIAFLLPATPAVCWFRRIGLAFSYTVMFGAILVKVLACFRQAACWTCSVDDKSNRQARQQHRRRPSIDSRPASQFEPMDESVELTFESLPGVEDVDPARAAPISTVPVVEGHQASVGSQQGPPSEAACKHNRPTVDSFVASSAALEPANLLKISLALIFLQVSVSLVWLIRQPPEPTLYFACWHCSSPSRSPVMFLYEPLLSLLQPALILVLTWALSVLSFKRILQNEQQFRVATRQSLLTSQQQQQQVSLAGNYRAQQESCEWRAKWHQLKGRQLHLEGQLREAKSLVMTTTLLVLTWSLLTLNMISSGHRSLVGGLSVAAMATTTTTSSQLASHVDDFSLVYANIISGSLVFFFLFVYRLNLFSRSPSKAGKFTIAAPGQPVTSARNNVLKFNQASEFSDAQTRGHQWGFSNVHHHQQPPTFLGSQFLASSLLRAGQSGQERLRLQQFSSYGTYNEASGQGDQQLGAAPSEASQQQQHRLRSICEFGSTLSSAAAAAAQTPAAPQKSLMAKGKSRLLLGGGAKSKKQNRPGKQAQQQHQRPASEHKLQRRQSNGSVASSTANLMRRFDEDSDSDGLGTAGDLGADQLDAISCAMSVASNSTSQLQGNDLYPIDCSIQLVETTTTSSATTTTAAPAAGNVPGAPAKVQQPNVQQATSVD